MKIKETTGEQMSLPLEEPGYYVVRMVDDMVASGPFKSRREAAQEQNRCDWWRKNPHGYDVAYGTQDDNGMFIDQENKLFKEDDVTEVTPALQPGSKIRTRKSGMEGVVQKIEGGQVFFKAGDGRMMKTAEQNVLPIEKLQDGSMGGINRSAPSNDVSYEHVLDEIMDKYMQQHDVHQGPERRTGEKPEPVPGLNRQKAEKIANALNIRLNDTVYVYKLAKDMMSLDDVPPTVRMAVYNLIQGMPVDQQGILKPYVVDKLRQIVAEHQLREEFENILTEWNKFSETEDDVTDITSLAHMIQAHKKKDQSKEPEKKGGTRDIPYHGWQIRIRQEGNMKWRWGVVNKEGKPVHSDFSTDEAGAITAAEEYIKTGGGTKQQSTNSITIDFNQNFRDHFTSEGEAVFVKFDKEGETPIMYLSLEPRQGFKKTHPRSSTMLPMSSLSAKESNEIGLQPNGRYILGDKEQISGDLAKFHLIFQSITQGKGDKMFLGKPGLTVAHNRD